MSRRHRSVGTGGQIKFQRDLEGLRGHLVTLVLDTGYRVTGTLETIDDRGIAKLRAVKKGRGPDFREYAIELTVQTRDIRVIEHPITVP